MKCAPEVPLVLVSGPTPALSLLRAHSACYREPRPGLLPGVQKHEPSPQQLFYPTRPTWLRASYGPLQQFLTKLWSIILVQLAMAKPWTARSLTRLSIRHRAARLQKSVLALPLSMETALPLDPRKHELAPLKTVELGSHPSLTVALVPLLELPMFIQMPAPLSIVVLDLAMPRPPSVVILLSWLRAVLLTLLLQTMPTL